ncbi:MAG: lipoyl synthase [Planctomycetes bacterium]|nr:lipoyl synthase [Planctomycetota bacterium]
MDELACLDLGRAAYRPVLDLQHRLVERIRLTGGGAYLVLVEHDPAVITLGRRGRDEDVLAEPARLAAAGVELVRIRRGGSVTWHGPGQLVAYPVLRLDPRRRSVHAHVHTLEDAVIDVLASLGIDAGRQPGRVGVWVGPEKIASIGVAVRRWIAYHGLALNVAGDVSGFSAIVPCGLAGVRATSVSRVLGREVAVEEVKPLLADALARRMGFETPRPVRPGDVGIDWPASQGDAPAGDEGTAGDSARGSPLGGEKAAGGAGRNTGGGDSSAGPARRGRLPRWFRRRPATGPHVRAVGELIADLGLATVCSAAHCPNRTECYARGTATFLILGEVCTRSCRFCAIPAGRPGPVDAAEAEAVAAAAERMGLRHVVITSVTRDDLPDGGAGHFARVVRAVRRRLPSATVEILTPDFRGDERALAAALVGGPDVFNHNVETVPRLYPHVRPEADYRRSLAVLRAARRLAGAGAEMYVKSGLMVGLGESRAEIRRVLQDLREAGCDMVTIGQYLAPSRRHRPVARFVEPAEFDDIRREAEGIGFAAVAAGPLVRSSYRAETLLRRAAAAARTS